MSTGSPLDKYREIWFLDFEFTAIDGGRPHPVCMVAKEMRSKRLLRLWEDELSLYKSSPIPTDSGVLHVAFFSTAEWSCYLALGWELPFRIIDLYTEFRMEVNGLPEQKGQSRGLLSAMAYYKLPHTEAPYKKAMRDMFIRGGEFSEDERTAGLVYCQEDVDALELLFPAMMPGIDIDRAVLRGRYTRAVARIEHVGVPIDMETFGVLKHKWTDIKTSLIEEIDKSYGVYMKGSFSDDLWLRYCHNHNIPWPMHEGGRPDLRDDTFKDMSKIYQKVSPIRELRYSLSKLKLNDLTVGEDGRNRVMLGQFGGVTGRNQPSNSKYIFGPSVWLRGLIKPKPGYGIAYVDYKSQEFGIAAALSGDQLMQEAYLSGDPYLAFGKQVGLIPEHITKDNVKDTHSNERELCKQCILGTNYGMEYESLAKRIGCTECTAVMLLRHHKSTYPKFWDWAEQAADYGQLSGEIQTVLGWTMQVRSTRCWAPELSKRGTIKHIKGSDNPRLLRNFPCQGNGAEMLRWACCYATESRLRVCAPIHDAILLESKLEHLKEDIIVLQQCMKKASRLILNGFEIETEVKLVLYPDRFRDEKRGGMFWDTVMELIGCNTSFQN